MLLKLLAFVFVALVFLGLGTSGTINAAFAGYHKVEQNPALQQVQNKALSIENSIQTQFENTIKSDLPRN
ncbi:exported hypothetical protein [Nitrosotalea sinensis]|jgi:hypothetical protein|uniref:Uncharacterized protein n=1 Tax=Nitrosotalea sinensis TaxID=1499975 RepID=A0A2H1EFT7_9ARCH|nr:hypothetical protein [Candidatus Nitrosotalea sinensis]SHO43587.1 exported hypothetical protein [Candidatus Nitrosotalea sinensis]